MSSVQRYTAKGRTLYRVHYRTPEHKQRSKSGFTTKRDAELFKASTEVNKARGDFIDAHKSKVTIGELAPRWLALKAHHSLSHKTRIDSIMRNHVLPRWGKTKIRDVRASDVQLWLNGLVAVVSNKRNGGALSASSKRHCLDVLRGILDLAVDDALILHNVVPSNAAPRTKVKKNIYLTPHQVKAIARAAGNVRPEYHTLVMLLGTTGIRWGEMTALRVNDIDFDKHRITITKSATRSKGAWEEKETKGREHRLVPLMLTLAGELRQHCALRLPTALVFESSAGGYIKPTNGPGHWFMVAVARAQKEDDSLQSVTPHDLRHAAASIAIASGADVKVVQNMLGHKDAAMTLNTYADLFHSNVESVAEGMNRMFAME